MEDSYSDTIQDRDYLKEIHDGGYTLQNFINDCHSSDISSKKRLKILEKKAQFLFTYSRKYSLIDNENRIKKLGLQMISNESDFCYLLLEELQKDSFKGNWIQPDGNSTVYTNIGHSTYYQFEAISKRDDYYLYALFLNSAGLIEKPFKFTLEKNLYLARIPSNILQTIQGRLQEKLQREIVESTTTKTGNFESLQDSISVPKIENNFYNVTMMINPKFNHAEGDIEDNSNSNSVGSNNSVPIQQFKDGNNNNNYKFGAKIGWKEVIISVTGVIAAIAAVLKVLFEAKILH